MKRVIVHIPLALCRIIAKFFEFKRNTLLTRATINNLVSNKNYDIMPAKIDFDYNPLDFKTGMKLTAHRLNHELSSLL